MTCGDIRYWSKCADGHAYPVREHCDHWTCPNCQKKLVAKQALMTADRLEFAVPEYGRLYHYVISFKTIQGRAHAISHLKKVGLLGGSIVEHRTPCRQGQHFHVVGFGNICFKSVAALYKKTEGDTFIKRIRIVKNVFKVHRYELGHAYCPRGKQIVAYWGCVSNRALGFKRDGKGRLPKGDLEPCLCPRCAKQTYKVYSKDDNVLNCYCEELYVRHPVHILEWKTRYKQDSISEV